MPDNRESFELGRLRQAIAPMRLCWFPRLRSTNDQAAAMRRRGSLFAPAAVLTGRQVAGRGRGSNTWWSAPGSLTVTFVLPAEAHLAAAQLPLVAGLAVRNAVARICGVDRILLKWPNDLIFEDRKLAGLLCERINKADLIGLGLNVNVDVRQAPRALRGRIGSLAEMTGQRLNMTDVLAEVARQVSQSMAHRGDRPAAQLLREYDRWHALVGRRVTVEPTGDGIPVTGRCHGIDHIGRLLVYERRQIHRIIAGHVQML